MEGAMGIAFIGFLILGLGAVGLFFVNRREFYRRNAAGIEEFTGYGSMLATKLFEKTIRLVSSLLLLAGITLIGLTYIHLHR